MTSVAVLGPGGVGGFLAAALARSGEDVTVVAREKTAAHIAAHGVSVDSIRLGRFTARPQVTTRLEQDVEVLIIATKAPALADALARIDATPALVVPLLNGVEHLPVLRERFDRVAAASIRVAAERIAPGRIVHTSPLSRVEMTSEGELFAHTLRLAEVPAKVVASEAQVLWSKLSRLNALALTTAASGNTLGEVLAHPRWRALLQGAVDETAAVANAEGAEIDPHAVLDELANWPPGASSSLARDVEQGRENELDAIGGAVVRAAARHGLPTPAVEQLIEVVRDRVR